MARLVGIYNQRNFLFSGDEDDLVVGGNEIDFMTGGGGNDRMFGRGGNDFMNGGDGNDYLNGGSGDDQMFGGAGNDIFVGGSGSDIMQGEDGEDRFYMGDGDFAKGGADADTFIWRLRADETINISDFSIEEGDVMRLSGASRYDWETVEAGNYTTVAFSNGAEVNFYGVSAEEIEANAGLFGL